MNFFAFSQTNRKFMIADNFWIYVATWLPLTLLTLLAYLMLKEFHEFNGKRVLVKLENLRSRLQSLGSKRGRHIKQDVENLVGKSG